MTQTSGEADPALPPGFRLTEEDLLSGRTRDDGIACGSVTNENVSTRRNSLNSIV